jgi:hypothetical protein
VEPRGWFVGLVMLACALGALGALAVGAEAQSQPVELTLQSIVHVRGGREVAILAEKDGVRRLPVVLSKSEAAQMDRAPRGPEGLFGASLGALGGRVLRASIDGAPDPRGLRGHVALSSSSGEVSIEASAGEALALAVQAGAPIVADPEVLDEAGITPDDLRSKAAGSKRRLSEPAPVLDI